jgi:hypothetical protein
MRLDFSLELSAFGAGVDSSMFTYRAMVARAFRWPRAGKSFLIGSFDVPLYR